MVLDVTIPQRNLKTFSNAIACLGRIGKDLFIEADEEHFMLRALNDAKSAFSAFTFRREAFFEDYTCGREDGSPATCRLMIKPIQHILKNLKRVLSLRIYMDEGLPPANAAGGEEQAAGAVEPHLMFDLHCDVGILKRHHFPLQDCEIVHALFHRQGASCLTAQASSLTQLLEHLQGSGHEVALVAGADHLCVRTCRTEEQLQAPAPVKDGGGANEPPGSAALSTEMTVHASDFDGYVFVGPPRPEGEEEAEGREAPEELKPVGMVLSVREVRAFLAFCELAECNPVTLYLHEGGRPVLFVYEEDQGQGVGGFGLHGGNEGVQSVELVLATMEPALTGEMLRGAGGGAAASASAAAGGGARGNGGGGGGGSGGGNARVKEETEGEGNGAGRAADDDHDQNAQGE